MHDHSNNTTVIISRHGHAISRWLLAQHRNDNYKHLQNIVVDSRARGHIDADTNVIGTIPYDLAKSCKQYYSIVFADPNHSGPDMTAEDMLDAKAYLQPYTVFPCTKAFIEDVLEHHLTKLAEYAKTNTVTSSDIKQIISLITENLND